MKEIKLFDYQEDMKERIEKALRLHRSVMAQMPTGTGKTVLLASVVESFLREHSNCNVWIVAHRRELVSQIRETIERVFSKTPSLLYKDFSNHPVNSSKITPSLFTLKEGSTSHPGPLTLRGEGGNRPTRCSEPLRSKDGGASKPSPNCAGWDRRGVSGDIASDASVSSAFTTDSSASTALDVVQRELKYLGLGKFAGAVMYVLHEALGLSEEKMIVPMDEKRGRLLLAEILDGGNFGRHFTKYAGFTHQSMGKKYFLKIWRNMHFVRYYPAEALCEPLFRTWHFFWRMKNKNLNSATVSINRLLDSKLSLWCLGALFECCISRDKPFRPLTPPSDLRQYAVENRQEIRISQSLY